MKSLKKTLNVIDATIPVGAMEEISTEAVAVAFEDTLYNAFKNPSIDYKSRPLWFWNGISDVSKIDKQWIKDTVSGSFASGYSGFGILPYGIGGYLSKEYFDMYKVVLDECKKYGMKLNLYDENGFPSGPAGDLFQKTYPQDTAKKLVKNEINIKGPAKGKISINLGTKDEPFMGAVAMNNDTKELIELTLQKNLTTNDVCYDLAEGDWKVMTFYVCRDGNNFCDYLDVQDVEKFIELTHQAYYNEFPEYFGDVIDMTFYDEPAMWRGDTWTEKYNEKFEAINGFSPLKYYPALWYDIGDDTSYARNKLFGFRADLFADGFIKTISDWCAVHNIKLTGHVGEEELVNPTSAAGDLMKVFRDQDIPGIDSVIFYGRISRALKVVSSSANNYDKQKVMTEIHGASDTLDVPTMYRDVMDQYAKGINLMVPHAVWYDPYGAGFMNPELSFRDPKWGNILPEYNNYIGRASFILQQEGRHVADIGVLYPINSLQNGYRFGGGYDSYKGGVTPQAEWNYMDIVEMLSLDVRRDFTYLHPDIIDNKCSVDGKILKLNNRMNFEQFKTIIIPGGDTISLSNLLKIKEFYDNGGLVIGSRQLPYMSSEKGKSNCVVQIIKEMFGVEPRASTGPIYTSSS